MIGLGSDEKVSCGVGMAKKRYIFLWSLICFRFSSIQHVLYLIFMFFFDFSCFFKSNFLTGAGPSVPAVSLGTNNTSLPFPFIFQQFRLIEIQVLSEQKYLATNGLYLRWWTLNPQFQLKMRRFVWHCHKIKNGARPQIWWHLGWLAIHQSLYSHTEWKLVPENVESCSYSI